MLIEYRLSRERGENWLIDPPATFLRYFVASKGRPVKIVRACHPKLAERRMVLSPTLDGKDDIYQTSLFGRSFKNI